jgi:hypothetical protein
MEEPPVNHLVLTGVRCFCEACHNRDFTLNTPLYAKTIATIPHIEFTNVVATPVQDAPHGGLRIAQKRPLHLTIHQRSSRLYAFLYNVLHTTLVSSVILMTISLVGEIAMNRLLSAASPGWRTTPTSQPQSYPLPAMFGALSTLCCTSCCCPCTCCTCC